MAKNGQIHNKMAVILKSGEIVTKEQFGFIFKNTKIEPVLYRISTQMWKLKKEGGIVKSIKNGRIVIGYQLLNADEFDNNGKWVGKIEHKEAA